MEKAVFVLLLAVLAAFVDGRCPRVPIHMCVAAGRYGLDGCGSTGCQGTGTACGDQYCTAGFTCKTEYKTICDGQNQANQGHPTTDGSASTRRLSFYGDPDDHARPSELSPDKFDFRFTSANANANFGDASASAAAKEAGFRKDSGQASVAKGDSNTKAGSDEFSASANFAKSGLSSRSGEVEDNFGQSSAFAAAGESSFRPYSEKPRAGSEDDDRYTRSEKKGSGSSGSSPYGGSEDAGFFTQSKDREEDRGGRSSTSVGAGDFASSGFSDFRRYGP